jgi:hypothetical protein
MSIIGILYQLQQTFLHPFYKPLCLAILILVYKMRQPKNSETSVVARPKKRPQATITIPKKYRQYWEEKYILHNLYFLKEIFSATPEGQRALATIIGWWEKKHGRPWKDPNISAGPTVKKAWTWIQEQTSGTPNHSTHYQKQWKHIITWWNNNIEQINVERTLAEIHRTKRQLLTTHPDKQGCTETTQLLLGWKKHLETLAPILENEWDPESNTEPITLHELCVQHAIAETIDAKKNMEKQIRIYENQKKYLEIISTNSLYHRHILQKRYGSVRHNYTKGHYTRPSSPAKSHYTKLSSYR